ncbi:dipeptidyl-peptidase-4 [Silvibacterium bohemicum]|uniref:Dipeptidyl-peptidase-4 n=1 Tax=Silvibacterium bohemicum TaxID=1577686 RepID=A0A841JY45_9BACT|nr:alpha/beta fold hydrolase [Silvibacterium bohemicum]MBB6146256.1 dipeptidyl-peptidase-4 [Silvibacterium bohemicum]
MRRLCAFSVFALAAVFVPSFHNVFAQKASAPTHPPTNSWTVKEIFGGDNLTGEPPSGISWSPDGSRATYLSDEGDVMQIQVADGKLKKLIGRSKINSLLNAEITEKDRDHRNRYDEPDYIWSPDSQHLLFDTNGDLWLYDLHNGTGIEVGNTGMQSGDDPKFSPNGQFISYVRDHNLYLQGAQQGDAPLALTETHDGTVLNGEIDWVYLEELDVRSNYFWSPDSKQLVYLQMNEAQVPTYPLTDWIPLHATVDVQRYPQPGDPNPSVRVGVVSATGGSTHWLKIPLTANDDYVPRFGWVNPHVVWVEVLTRDQKHENLYFADTRTGEVKLALAQTEPKYFTLTYDVTFVGDHQFLIQSWRDGFTHIYRYTFDAGNPLGSEAQLANQLESGTYEATEVKTVDEAASTVYYLSSEGDSHEQQVWAVQLDGSGKRRVTRAAGFHDPDFPAKGGSFIDTASTLTTPPTVSYCTAQGDCTPFWSSHKIVGHTLVAPEQLELKAADGTTTLYGTLQLPVDATAAASVPLVVNPYGGPGVGAAKNKWDGREWLFDQLMAEHGFAVLHVDNRGMAGRGRDFEQAAYHNFGPPQLADQLTSIDQVLAKYPQLDAHRLGWWGWSWGGTFTLYALSHSDRFLAGASGAPVTDWRNYDSIYTERYLGLPAANPDVYQADSVQNAAKDLKGHLLLLHGTGDDNVHFANTIQYIQKLLDAGIPYDYNVFPRKTHSVAGPIAQTELHNRLLQQFEMYVKSGKE